MLAWSGSLVLSFYLLKYLLFCEQVLKSWIWAWWHKLPANIIFHKWVGIHLVHFPSFCTRETTLLTSCLLSFTPSPCWKWVYSKQECKSFPFRIHPFSEGKQNGFGRVASHESVSIAFIFPFFSTSKYWVCHLVCEFVSTTRIKQSDWLKFRSGCGIFIQHGKG